MILFYAHIHTRTRYKSGLLALNTLPCARVYFSESELVDMYGSDAGLAFWLMGELNAQLNQNKEAAKFFKAALEYNPMLWTAYQSLCEMGKSLSLSLSLSLSHTHTHTSHLLTI